MRRSFAMLALAGASAMLAVPTATAAAQAAHHNSPEAVVRTLFDKTWSEGSFDQLEQLLAPGLRFHFRGRANEMSATQFRDMVMFWRTAYPDLRFRIDDILSTGDRVAARFTFTGTHRGEAFGLQPTGRAVSVTMMGFFRFVDGRVVEMWEDFDEHGMRQQLTRPAS